MDVTAVDRRRRELPGCRCPKCGKRGKVCNLSYRDQSSDAVAIRWFERRCECVNDAGRPIRWKAEATDLRPPQ